LTDSSVGYLADQLPQTIKRW